MKLKSIQAARAVAASAVMLSHLQVVEQKYGHGFTLLPEWFRLGACGVDLFFVLSGFIMVTIASRESWRHFLLARATRIVPPYWFFSGLVLVVSLIAPGMVNGSFSHFPSVWRSFLLVPDTVEPVLAVGWTLTHEAYFYVVFAAFLATGGVRLASLCVWIAIVFTVRLMLPNPPTQEDTPILFVALHPLTLEFICGACVGLVVCSGLTKGPVVAFVVGVAALMGFLGTIDNPLQFARVEAGTWERVLKIGVPFALTVYGLATKEKAGGAAPWKWLVRLGDASYSTYLSHVLVLSAVGRCFALLPVHDYGAELGFVALCIIATNAVGLLSYRLLEQPILLFFRRALAGFANS